MKLESNLLREYDPGMYPVDSHDYEDFKTSLLKLKLNDAALTFEANVSTALGFGFRCGFLGPLHMEIVQERLEREFGMNLISTAPNVSYNILTKKAENILVKNPADMPNPGDIDTIKEPYIKAEIISPDKYIGNIRITFVKTYYPTNTNIHSKCIYKIMTIPQKIIIHAK